MNTYCVTFPIQQSCLMGHPSKDSVFVLCCLQWLATCMPLSGLLGMKVFCATRKDNLMMEALCSSAHLQLWNESKFSESWYKLPLKLALSISKPICQFTWIQPGKIELGLSTLTHLIKWVNQTLSHLIICLFGVEDLKLMGQSDYLVICGCKLTW